MNKKNNQNTNNKLELNYIISDHLKKSHKPNTIDEFYPYLAGYNQENGRLRKIWKEEKCRSIKIKKEDLPLINYIKKNLTQEGKRGVADLKSGKIKIIKSFKEINYVIEDQDISIIGPRQRGQSPLWAFNIHRGRPRLEGSGGWEYKYPNYWLTGYVDRNIKWKDIKLNMKILIKRNIYIFKKEPTPIVFVIKNVGPRFPTNDILMEKIKGELNSNLISGPRLPSVPSGGLERLKGKAARPPYKIKERFPTKKIRSIIWYLDKYPLISYKYIKYIKIRKIYRICQRKEHLTKKGLLKILSIWRYHNYLT